MSRQRWVLLATILGSSIVFIDGTVVTLALPSMQRAFGASAAGIAWIVESYALVLGSMMLLAGAVADRYGRRRVFAIGIVVFALGSVGCALAQSLAAMLVMRVVQGVGGTMLAPASLALIADNFEGDERGRAIAAWSAFGALTSTLGPAVGGLFVDHLGWRSVFWINVPLAAIVLYATLVHVRESRDELEAGTSLDVAGALLCIAALGALTYALIASSFVAGGLAALFGVAFFVVEKRVAHPLLPLELFASRSFSGVNLATLFLYGALGANFYFLPLVMIQAHGYSATSAALASLPLGACIVALSALGAASARRFGRRAVLVAGPLTAALGFALIAVFEPAGSYWQSFFPGIVVLGIGMGFTVAPLTSTVIDSVDPHRVGTASGINNAVSRIAGLLAIAAFTLVITVAFNAALDRALDATHATQQQRAAVDAQRPRMGGAHVDDAALQQVVTGAFRSGYRAVAAGCALLALLASATGLILVRNASQTAGKVAPTRSSAQ